MDETVAAKHLVDKKAERAMQPMTTTQSRKASSLETTHTRRESHFQRLA